jgi:HD superfamily phosphohydrolase
MKTHYLAGTGYLAGELAKRLFEQQPHLKESDEWAQETIHAVTLAGLCHDLGHGPFSHLFELAMENIKYCTLAVLRRSSSTCVAQRALGDMKQHRR